MRHNYDVENAILYAVFIIGAIAIVAVMYFFYFRDRIKERKKTAKKLSVKLKEKETREFLIAYWWVFFVIIVFLIFMVLYLLGALEMEITVLPSLTAMAKSMIWNAIMTTIGLTISCMNTTPTTMIIDKTVQL